MLCKIGYSLCEPVNWIFGYLSQTDEDNVANLILSVYRWIVWKRNCDLKYQNEGRDLCIRKKFLNYLYNHLEILLKSKKLRMKDVMYKQCEDIAAKCKLDAL